MYYGRKKINCPFCNKESSANSHFEKYGLVNNPDLAHILETDNTYIKPELLSSSPDGMHLLLIPKPHRLSFTALPELANEVGHAIQRIEDEFQRSFVFFEHGSAMGGESKLQSVYHQHGHLIPDGNSNILEYMADRLKKVYKIPFKIIDTPDKSPIVNLKQYFKGFNYLYIQQGRKGLIAHDNKDGDPTDSFPSQMTQKSMSLFLGHVEIDWKLINQKEEFARLSAQRMANLIAQCKI